MIEVERVRDDRGGLGVIERALEPELSMRVLRSVRVVLDGDARELFARGPVFFHMCASHLGVDARERRPGEALPLGFAGDAEPVLRCIRAHVRHNLEAAREGDVCHAGFDRLDGLAGREAARRAGVLDAGTGDAVEANVFGHRRPGETELTATDAECADERFIDVGRLEPLWDVFYCGVERRSKQ